MKNLQTKKRSNGGNFAWLIQQMSINQKSGGGRRFVEGSYQALLSFRLARRNVIYKAKRKLSLISGYQSHHIFHQGRSQAKTKYVSFSRTNIFSEEGRLYTG